MSDCTEQSAGEEEKELLRQLRLLESAVESRPPQPGASAEETQLDLAHPETPDRIGPYRLLQTVGEGGMGVVYQAEQEEPVRRRVALKLIKWGWTPARSSPASSPSARPSPS